MEKDPIVLLPGTKPPGATSQVDASRYVRKLFSDVAGRYDLLNHLLSMNVDRYWRWAAAREFSGVLNHPTARILDLCCGTGDLSLALAKRGPAPVYSCDFSHNMLKLGVEKVRAAKLLQSPKAPVFAEADALCLPFSDAAFDLVACAWGFRNLANYPAGLNEIWRVLRPGGQVGILEFSEPSGILAPLYSFYFHHVLPKIGEWIAGVGGAYRYLASSVDRFPNSKLFLAMMQDAGFQGVRVRKLTGGIAILYIGQRPAE